MESTDNTLNLLLIEGRFVVVSCIVRESFTRERKIITGLYTYQGPKEPQDIQLDLRGFRFPVLHHIEAQNSEQTKRIRHG